MIHRNEVLLTPENLEREKFFVEGLDKSIQKNYTQALTEQVKRQQSAGILPHSSSG